MIFGVNQGSRTIYRKRVKEDDPHHAQNSYSVQTFQGIRTPSYLEQSTRVGVNGKHYKQRYYRFWNDKLT